MDALDLATAREIIDFSGGQESLQNLGELQLKGAVALHNMIADPNIGLGYLADEVGMGKTYIALGVVALMRTFNPELKVLYICPSRNLQEKWEREYRSFIKTNIKIRQYHIRTLDGKPAMPYISCRRVSEMIQMTALGYYTDFFVGKDSFSISLSNDDAAWEKQIRSISEFIPAHQWDGIVRSKFNVKEQYARALNYILPVFDLVIIDEAHNFKHDFNSSDRNKVLSRALGISEEPGFQKRVNNALLLSGTPYDRDINQLRNQLNLVGKSNLIEGLTSERNDDIVASLKRFMVRRLNRLQINGSEYTRNMYRKEHRTGSKAEIKLNCDEQKLVTALVQKKVGEMMGNMGNSSSFQTGMLASFESYAQTSKIEPVQFDGDEADKIQTDAKDRHVIAYIVESYKVAGLGSTLPHPKMDAVCRSLANDLFMRAKKQIVFVRRVKSVSEIKAKLDDHYNQWLHRLIEKRLVDQPAIQQVFENLFAELDKQSRRRDDDISEGVFVEGGEGDTEDSQPPKSDTFFAWFFRGTVETQVPAMLKIADNQLTTPELLRRALTAKNQQISVLLEFNWAKLVCREEGLDLDRLLRDFSVDIADKAKRYRSNIDPQDYPDIFQACQLGFIDWYQSHNQTAIFAPLLKYSSATMETGGAEITTDQVIKNLQFETFYSALYTNGLDRTLFPLPKAVYRQLQTDITSDQVAHLLDKLNAHSHLVSLCLRTGHGIVDVYISRIKQGPANLTETSRQAWLDDIMAVLKDQSAGHEFSTYHELKGLAEQLDLIIKTNLPEIFDHPVEARRKFVSHRLNPVSPVIGATGETYNNRSAQARKFRMPGYPLALISTDVFQEGEDLHTFCDNVMHYGLSGSPVSIEQKTGRVDRVNSCVQRRLLNYPDKKIAEDDLIQVFFPYVKESIELLQVRQLCRNINDFIASLHEIGGQERIVLDVVETDKEIADKSAIPEQINSFLQSPYTENVPETLNDSKQALVAHETQLSDAITRHVESLITNKYRLDVFTQGYPIVNRQLSVRLDTARRIGAILLVGSAENRLYQLSEHRLQDWIQAHSWTHLYRTQAEEVAQGHYRLYANCEMLIGDEKITQEYDIEHFFDRFVPLAQAIELNHPRNEKIYSYWNRVVSGGIDIKDAKLNTTFSCFETDGALGVKVTGRSEALRTHNIYIYESSQYCVFIAQSVTESTISQIQGKQRDKKIIEHTWIRNKHVDIVDFFLDQQGNISGRILHPIKSLDWEEFVFYVYILAVEADRLEYVFSQEDVL